MFAPNRLLTPKEQWLLIGFIVAVALGCGAIYFLESRSGNDMDAPTKFVVATADLKQDSLAQNHRSAVIATQTPPAVVHPVPVIPEKTAQADNADGNITLPEEEIGVAIMGAVHRPDLYYVPPKTRVSDLIQRAGGTTQQADLSDILLTAEVIDGTTLTIPEHPQAHRSEDSISIRRSRESIVSNPPQYRRIPNHFRQGAGTTSALASKGAVAGNEQTDAARESSLININQATLEELQQLPGIGPVFAARIIEERQKQPFASVAELRRVSGIGEKRLDSLLPFIVAP